MAKNDLFVLAFSAADFDEFAFGCRNHIDHLDQLHFFYPHSLALRTGLFTDTAGEAKISFLSAFSASAFKFSNCWFGISS